MIEIDTKIRHVTNSGTNLFLDLGIEPEEAERCHIESRQHINHLLSIKNDLITELNNWIDDEQLPQEEAARILHIPKPLVADVINKNAGRFTLDALVDMVIRSGKPVRFAVG